MVVTSGPTLGIQLMPEHLGSELGVEGQGQSPSGDA